MEEVPEVGGASNRCNALGKTYRRLREIVKSYTGGRGKPLIQREQRRLKRQHFWNLALPVLRRCGVEVRMAAGAVAVEGGAVGTAVWDDVPRCPGEDEVSQVACDVKKTIVQELEALLRARR